ncbi:hypothetical protein, partial [Paratractidigestivibacter sp.]|uniref:hypothetical protein n=1 Tax=Paratractidigestivibacter sp. TaxID=2847316 RepID=UPI00402A26AC
MKEYTERKRARVDARRLRHAEPRADFRTFSYGPRRPAQILARPAGKQDEMRRIPHVQLTDKPNRTETRTLSSNRELEER